MYALKPNLSERRRIPAIVMIMWALIVLNAIHSQAARYTDYLPVRTVSAGDGLPSTWVFRVAQDREGFIWFACWGGVSRFDGTSIINYSHAKGLPGGTLYTSVCQLSDGRMVAGSVFEGLFQLKGSSWSRVLVSGDVFRYGVEDLLQDSNGDIWIASRNGVWRSRFQDDGLVARSSGFEDNVIRSLMLDKDGMLWAGGRGFIGKYSDGKWETFSLPTEADPLVNGMSEDKGCIWLATSSGLYRFDTGTHIITVAYVPEEDAVTRSVLIQQNGSMWVSGRAGVYTNRKGEWTHYTKDSGLAGENITHLFRDSNGNIWMPSRTDGVMVMAPDRFENYRFFGPDSGRYVKAVFQDDDGTLWVGTEKGLYVRRGRDWRRVVLSPGPPERSIYGILRLPDGSLLVTSYLRVDRLNEKGCEDLKSRYDLPDATYLSPRLDGKGRVWIATINSGLIVLEDDSWRQIPVGSGTYMSQAVYSTYRRANGELLFGTYDGRVFQLKGDQLVAVLPGVEKLGVPVQAMAEDDNGTIWIGTAGEGLYRLNDGRLDAHAPADGFPATQCMTIGTVGDRLVVGTNHGLVVGTPGRWALYDERDGLPGVEFQIGAIAKLKDGRLAMGTDRGLTLVSGRFLDRSPQPILTRFTAIENGKHDMLKGPDPSIRSEHSEVQFAFIGLEFLNPRRVLYRYRLDPEDEDWTKTEVRQVHYQSLKPGPHVFRVQAAGPMGNWGPETEFRFSVVPGFWQTRWFLVIAVLGLSLLGGLALKGTRLGFNRVLAYHQRNWFGHFRIRAVLGQGGMAVVYRATNRKTGREVALKVLQTGLLNCDGETRFIREGIICAHLEHNNIVQVLDHGIHNGRPWLELELVNGQTLTSLVKDAEPFPILKACCVIRVLLDVIEYIHENGIIHRDLKPDNLMILHAGESSDDHSLENPDDFLRDSLRVLDFGIARFMDLRTVTRIELDSGTPLFRPPETFFGENRSSQGVDVYATGMIFYYILTGHFPYESESNDPAETIGQILYRDALPVHHWRSDVPEELDRLVMSMIDKDPERRERNVAAIRERINPFLNPEEWQE